MNITPVVKPTTPARLIAFAGGVAVAGAAYVTTKASTAARCTSATTWQQACTTASCRFADPLPLLLLRLRSQPMPLAAQAHSPAPLASHQPAFVPSPPDALAHSPAPRCRRSYGPAPAAWLARTAPCSPGAATSRSRCLGPRPAAPWCAGGTAPWTTAWAS